MNTSEEMEKEREHMLATYPDEASDSNKILRKNPETITAAPEIDTTVLAEKSNEVGEARIVNPSGHQEDPDVHLLSNSSVMDQPHFKVDSKNLDIEMKNTELTKDINGERPRTPEPEPQMHEGFLGEGALYDTSSIEDGENKEELSDATLHYASKPEDIVIQEDRNIEEDDTASLKDSNEPVVDNPIVDHVHEDILSQHLPEADSPVDRPIEKFPVIKVLPVQQQAQVSTDDLSDVPHSDSPVKELDGDTVEVRHDQQQDQVSAEDTPDEVSCSDRETDEKASVKAFITPEGEHISNSTPDILDSNIDEVN